MKVELTKIYLNEGAVSRVRVGATALGELSVLRKIEDFSEIKENDEIYVSGFNRLKTSALSALKEVIPYEDGLTLITQTSTYKLEKVKEEEDGSTNSKGDAK